MVTLATAAAAAAATASAATVSIPPNDNESEQTNKKERKQFCQSKAFKHYSSILLAIESTRNEFIHDIADELKNQINNSTSLMDLLHVLFSSAFVCVCVCDESKIKAIYLMNICFG